MAFWMTKGGRYVDSARSLSHNTYVKLSHIIGEKGQDYKVYMMFITLW